MWGAGCAFAAMTTPITCLVADDHPAVLHALAGYLESEGVEITATASDGHRALELIQQTRPLVAVLDIGMPRLSGLDVARQLPRVAVETAAVVYTGLMIPSTAVEALDAGARGIVLKEAPLGELLRAVEFAAEGRTYVDPALAGALTSTGRNDEPLTARERDVLRLLSIGLSNEEIGRELFISAETVRTHVGKALTKLQASTRAHAVATALRRSLIS